MQEVEARVDQGFINAIMSILQPEGESGFRARQKMLDNFHEQDGAELGRSLHDTVSLGTGTEMPVLFDHLVVHPLKLHISFSMTGADSKFPTIQKINISKSYKLVVEILIIEDNFK